jgi:hypothetical protein
MTVDVEAQKHALKVLLESEFAVNRHSEFERRISAAILRVQEAVFELRNALQADPKKTRGEINAVDPSRQSVAAQDVAADEILIIAASLLPRSGHIKAAIKAAAPRAGNSEINDRAALIEMARRLIESGGAMAPKAAARLVALRLVAAHSVNSTVDRLRRKFMKDRAIYDALAAARIRFDAAQEASIAYGTVPKVHEIGDINRINANAEAKRIAALLLHTREREHITRSSPSSTVLTATPKPNA